jgi:hypothetical protein
VLKLHGNNYLCTFIEHDSNIHLLNEFYTNLNYNFFECIEIPVMLKLVFISCCFQCASLCGELQSCSTLFINFIYYILDIYKDIFLS